MTECFLYGNRLKATIQEFNNSYQVNYYTYGKTPYKRKLFFNSNKSMLELYREALESARKWLNTCKY